MHDTRDSVYEELSKHPERQRRFKGAMEYFQPAPGFEATHVLDSFDLSEDGTIVDVGGSHGIVSIELARKFSIPQFR